MALAPEKEKALREILPHMAATNKLCLLLYKLRLFIYPVDNQRQLRLFAERRTPS